MVSKATAAPPAGLALVDRDHDEHFRRALLNVLSLDVAEFTYAQILDGLPTVKSLRESYWPMATHPVNVMNHTELCERSLDKARDFRALFDPADLVFEESLLCSFQKTVLSSEDFKLRLIELVVVACHQIAAYLFDLDDGVHKHELHQDWVEQQLRESTDEYGIHKSGYILPPAVVFFHRGYCDSEQYPRGLADVAAYWAEDKIFGGVVVFDRAESEQEAKAMWIHSGRMNGPRTLYPPTPEQFDALVQFLLAGPKDTAPCPLPMHGTDMNRPRWDPYDALARYHIFRDKYGRKLPPEPPRPHCVRRPVDWPELDDRMFLFQQAQLGWQGLPVDNDAIAAAEARLREVTPSSPCWGGPR